jgi:hypothetical protein
MAEEDGAVLLNVLANDTDVDGDALTVTAVTPAANGAVVIAADGLTLTYTPNPNFSGADSFSYMISDGNGGTASALVTVMVAGGNSAPTANAGADQMLACTSPSKSAVTLNGSGSTDADGDTLTFTWTGSFGTATGIRPTVMLPLGVSAVTLVVNDGQVDSAPDAVTITVTVGVEGLRRPMAALVPEGSAPPFPAHSFKKGRVLPLRLRLFCGTMTLTPTHVSAPRIVALKRDGQPLDINVLDLEAGKHFRLAFHYTQPDWAFNLKTRGLLPGTYTITIQLPDGRRMDAGFVLKDPTPKPKPPKKIKTLHLKSLTPTPAKSNGKK